MTIDVLREWIARAESALRHYEYASIWARQVGEYTYQKMQENSDSTYGAVYYMDMIYDGESENPDKKWWKLENIFWQYAVMLYRSEQAPHIPDQVCEILCMAQDFSIDEWGLSSD